MRKVLILGDVHAPWGRKKTLDRFFDYASDNGPWDMILQGGDALDWFSASRFARSHNVCTPDEEINEGRLQIEEIWRILNKIDKKSKKVQLLGNHCERPLKRVLEVAPYLEKFVRDGIKGLYTFDNVHTVKSAREVFEYDGVLYQHGYLGKLGDHARFNMQSTVSHHTHRGGVVFFPCRGKMLFELNAGFCADPDAVPMRYGLTTVSRWTQGWGVIDEDGPAFISEELWTSGRRSKNQKKGQSPSKQTWLQKLRSPKSSPS